jgi:uncharacterized protein YfaS (alpha-2-macroglobulin family)
LAHFKFHFGISIILPDMLQETGKLQNNELWIEGENMPSQNVKTFPFRLSIKQKGKITIRKTGNYPLYLTVSEKFWNPAPTPRSVDFKVETQFSAPTLTAGKPIKLIAKVEVIKQAEYVMIEIPIPAGCSYENTSKSWRNQEIYREYFREKVCIYCQKLPVGTYQYEVELLPRYTGSYTLNPAKTEMMYFPIFYGRNSTKRVKVVKSESVRE